MRLKEQYKEEKAKDQEKVIKRIPIIDETLVDEQFLRNSIAAIPRRPKIKLS